MREVAVTGHKPTPEQRRRALVSAVVLAAMVAGIYLTIILKFAR